MTLDDDIARAVDEVRRERGLGVSAALNELARRGLGVRTDDQPRFRQRTSDLGVPSMPLDDVASVLDVVEAEARRG